jgi:hypothetical protein
LLGQIDQEVPTLFKFPTNAEFSTLNPDPRVKFPTSVEFSSSEVGARNRLSRQQGLGAGSKG